MHYDKAFISIPRGKDPLTLSLEEAIELIEQKEQNATPLQQWGDIQVLNGRYGAYIRTPEGNFQLPKNANPSTITEAEARAIITQSATIKPRKRTFYKKSTK